VDDDDRLVVQLEGDLDVVSAGPVGDQLCSLVEVGELIIEVDCRAVTFIESRGLAMMARVQRLANESGCLLTWRALPLHAKATLKIPLQCYVDQGLDLAGADLLFAIDTDKPFVASVANIRWQVGAGKEAGALPCTPAKKKR